MGDKICIDTEVLRDISNQFSQIEKSLDKLFRRTDSSITDVKRVASSQTAVINSLSNSRSRLNAACNRAIQLLKSINQAADMWDNTEKRIIQNINGNAVNAQQTASFDENQDEFTFGDWLQSVLSNSPLLKYGPIIFVTPIGLILGIKDEIEGISKKSGIKVLPDGRIRLGYDNTREGNDGGKFNIGPISGGYDLLKRRYADAAEIILTPITISIMGDKYTIGYYPSYVHYEKGAEISLVGGDITTDAGGVGIEGPNAEASFVIELGTNVSNEHIERIGGNASASAADAHISSAKHPLMPYVTAEFSPGFGIGLGAGIYRENDVYSLDIPLKPGGLRVDIDVGGMVSEQLKHYKDGIEAIEALSKGDLRGFINAWV